MRIPAVLFAIAASVSLHALEIPEYSMTPTSGPSTGGTEVTITGDLPDSVQFVLFGSTGGTNVRRVDANTLVVTTPEHLPGEVSIEFLDFTRFTPTGLKFTFTGDVPAAYERLLLPIFLDPIRGQFGSEFVTSFDALLQRGEHASFHGFAFACRFICPPNTFGSALGVSREFPRLEGDSLVRSGNPGRFIYMRKEEVANVAMSLRVFDRSRTAQNYGTEIPIVRDGELTQGVITLMNVPTDARFRNTLRIYATGPTQVTVRVTAPTISPVDHQITLPAGANVFQPATATFSTFPTNVGPATVTITSPEQAGAPRVWAFVSVTNNDTQLITTVTPQP